jgi:hypothetical protein
MAMRKLKVVWGALERQGKTYWSRIGLAWEGRGGAVYAKISAVPLNGKICITPGTDEPPADEVAELLTGEVAS